MPRRTAEIRRGAELSIGGFRQRAEPAGLSSPSSGSPLARELLHGARIRARGRQKLEARHDVPHTSCTLLDDDVMLVRAWRAARWPLSAVALTMLTGCLMVGPDFQSPPPPAIGGFLPGGHEQVPGAVLIAGAEISARWWDVFHSRNLNRLIQDGIENNPDLQAAEAAVRVAQANALSLRGTLFPVINATFDASRQMIPGQTLTSNA